MISPLDVSGLSSCILHWYVCWNLKTLWYLQILAEAMLCVLNILKFSFSLNFCGCHLLEHLLVPDVQIIYII